VSVGRTTKSEVMKFVWLAGSLRFQCGDYDLEQLVCQKWLDYGCWRGGGCVLKEWKLLCEGF
jgi:hypothetical protein